ncbi:phage minor tail protein L [Escherichia coli]
MAKGTSTRPTPTVSNLCAHGRTRWRKIWQSLVGVNGVVRRKACARFLDAVNFVNGNSDADPEQEVISRWRIEQCSELSAVSASLYCPRRLKRMVPFFRGASCWLIPAPGPYRGDECGYNGPAVADEYDSADVRYHEG